MVKKMSSFSLTNYTIKILNRFVSILTRYLLIRFLSLIMLLYNRYSYILKLVNTVVIFCIIVLLGSWVASFCIDHPATAN